MDKKPHLRSVKIEGYKSIQSLDLEMNPINILIGANGAGKSNFISLFSLFRAIAQGKFQNFVENNGGANSLVYFGAKRTSKIVIDLEVDINGYHVELVHEPFDDKLLFSNEYCTIRSSSKKYDIKGVDGESGLFEGTASSGHVRDYTKKYMKQCMVYHFHDTSRTAGFKQTASLDASNYLYDDARNIAAFLYFLRKYWSDSYKEIVQSVRSIAPFFHDFYLETRGEEGNETILLKWLHKEHDEPFSAQQLSDGTARFICMATLFLQPSVIRPDTIILDEPELGLHPAAIEVLADIIKSVSKESQVVCSTQSVTFANLFSVEDFIVVDQEKGKSVFHRPNSSELAEWLDEYGMGDIWTKNLIGGRPEW